MTYRINGSDAVEFTVSGHSQTFELVYEGEALRKFVELAGRALVEMSALDEQGRELADSPNTVLLLEEAVDPGQRE
ncbi:hypothetical protein [Actinoalloteichus caeruleus]|nr:hypothetical protein [Actinoalloteichus caeruleus]